MLAGCPSGKEVFQHFDWHHPNMYPSSIKYTAPSASRKIQNSLSPQMSLPNNLIDDPQVLAQRDRTIPQRVEAATAIPCAGIAFAAGRGARLEETELVDGVVVREAFEL